MKERLSNPNYVELLEAETGVRIKMKADINHNYQPVAHGTDVDDAPVGPSTLSGLIISAIVIGLLLVLGASIILVFFVVGII